MLKLSIYTIIVLFLFSCKKTPTQQEVKPIVYANYSNFAPGSYWVYENFYIHASGDESATLEYDSMWAAGDTMIRGHYYYKMGIKGKYGSLGYSYFRDSLHYIVNLMGERIFSSVDFSSLLYYNYMILGKDTICKREFSMEGKEDFVNTSAGTFKTRNMKLSILFFPGQNDPYNVLYSYTKYAENIGMVSEDYGFTFGTLEHYERRLLRYKINKK